MSLQRKIERKHVLQTYEHVEMAVAQVSTAAAASANSGGIIQPSKACPPSVAVQCRQRLQEHCKRTAEAKCSIVLNVLLLLSIEAITLVESEMWLNE